MSKDKKKDLSKDTKNLTKLTLLHSNDMHGDFLSESVGEKVIGGISMLSGYVEKARTEDENVLYCISGDMLQGSLIDAEFRGLSTIEIMNLLSPDIVSLGNHEIDYGLGHLLLLEKCAKFPIVNSNIYIKNPYARLFQSHKIIKKGGMKIMFIGIITNEVLSPLKQDALLGTLVDVEEAAKEIGRICNAYRTKDIDFTVILSHIGFEEDKHLAELLSPDWGVDVIIGGHSHTILEKPEEVNGILITQAGVGTDQIGRFDIMVNTDSNSVDSYKWELIPIDDEHCPNSKRIDKVIEYYKKHVDDKYDQILCVLNRTLTHPTRYAETELGNLFTDALKDVLEIDIAIVGSGSIRKESAGPIITRKELLEICPYDDKYYGLKVTGKQLKKMYLFMLRDEAFDGEHTEFYQFSKPITVKYDRKKKEIVKFEFLGVPIEDDSVFTIGLQSYHYSNFEDFFGIPIEEVAENGKIVPITTSINDIYIEYFSKASRLSAKVEGRLVVK